MRKHLRIPAARHQKVSRRAATWLLTAFLLVSAGTFAFAQGRGRYVEDFPNAEYDGRYVFARISYSEPMNFSFRRGGGAPWSHDYPRAERNFLKLLSELSSINVRSDASTIISLDNPELFRFPVIYMAEPGFWAPSPEEVDRLREYLLKGGFMIFDDFAGRDWFNFEGQLQKVLPGAIPIRLDVDHPIFDSFYRIAKLDQVHPLQQIPAEYYGVFEDNDPSKRMLMIVNYNNDIAEWWEFSDEGFFPIELSNEAYKIGINYIIYALSR